MRRLRAAFVVVAALAAVPSSAVADGGVGYRVDGEPGSMLEDGFITLHLGPGGSASGHFEATNTSRSNAQLSVYSSDGLTGDTTGIVYSDAGYKLKDAGAWLTPSVGGMLLPANSSRRIDFSVRVPANARTGDHVGGIVLEQRRTGGAISQVVRNVVPVLVDVQGGAGTSIDLRSALVSQLPGTDQPAVIVKMVNDGRRICRPTLTVALTGPSERGAPVSRQLDALLPGDGVPFPLPWPRTLDAGTYQASVTTTGCGATETLRTDVRSTLPYETDPPRGNNGTNSEPVVTAAPPDTGSFTAPRGGGKNGTDEDRSQGSNVPPFSASGSAGGGTPSGASGSSSKAATAKGGSFTGPGKLFSDLGDVAIKYLPPLLERLVAPLSLLGLMLLFLFAQETFDRKDPKLALAPIHRDPDLEFLPLSQLDAPFQPDASPGDLEVVRSPSAPSPAPG
ncbi:MAG: hypothetical protein J7513_16290 [Solirubrobacteraceae bacterium]|nr:hypothetical protein [Solirubrobacteraceae bacterium]